MSRSIVLAPGEHYHVYNRGADKRKIFLDRADYERFISLLYLANSGIPLHRSDYRTKDPKEIFLIPREAPLVDIGAYCLMPNHFHILLHEHSEGGISTFMQKLTTGYTMYFNKRHERRGTLLEGTFKAQHVGQDEYLKYLFAYIHLNPIGIIEHEWKEHRIKDKKAAEAFIDSYRYSSFLDYAKEGGLRAERAILNPYAFPKYFERQKAFREYVRDWMEGISESE
jgi:putative transposase